MTDDVIVGFRASGRRYTLTRDMVDQIQFDNAFTLRYSDSRGDARGSAQLIQIPEKVKEGTKSRYASRGRYIRHFAPTNN